MKVERKSYIAWCEVKTARPRTRDLWVERGRNSEDQRNLHVPCIDCRDEESVGRRTMAAVGDGAGNA